jgi:pyruvyl transferase EpsO
MRHPDHAAMQSQPQSNNTQLSLDVFWRQQQRCLLGTLDRVVPPRSAVCYLDYPVYSNVGDLLIYHGTESWLAQRGHDVVSRASLYDFAFARIPEYVTIVCQGGGNFGDLYRHQAFRESVVEHYPANRIVFLPQSLHYHNEAGLHESSRRLCNHTDLHLLMRDTESLGVAERSFPNCRHYLMPDMAVMLHPFPKPDATPRTRQRLCLFRADVERSMTQPTPNGLCDWSGDWKQLLGPRYIALRALQAGIVLGGMLFPNAVSAAAWHAFTRNIIRHCAIFISTAQLVETSRLHGHILASLLGIPSRLHDNSYGKNSAYYRLWHSDMPLPGQSLVAG